MIYSGSSERAKWHEQAQQYHLNKNYDEAAKIYENAIELEPEEKSYYWHLGLMLLLQGKEEEAHTTWLLGMMDGEGEQLEEWTKEVIQVLETEAHRSEDLKDYLMAWLVRGHIREIQPENLNNLLSLIEVSMESQLFTGQQLEEWGVIELLHQQQPGTLEATRLLAVLEKVLESDPLHPTTLKFAALSMPHVYQHSDFLKVILLAAVEVANFLLVPPVAVFLLELFLRIDDTHPEVLGNLATFYQNSGNYSLGIEMARRYALYVEELPDKVQANYLILRGLMSAGGYWSEASAVLDQQESLLLNLREPQLRGLPQAQVSRLQTSAFFFPYFRDLPQTNRKIQNQVARVCQSYFQDRAKEPVERYHQRAVNLQVMGSKERSRPLKIGYLSHCLKSHSVGWLARWLFQYHDRDHFDIHLYLIGYRERKDSLQEWYAAQGYRVRKLEYDPMEIAEKIHEDNIDILIELDSVTLDITCQLMALKPAPVQVTWLGWDASGLPSIDYFLADPYVLPEDAPNYYAEKIWRLPQTYIAVDGFEVGVPTLRREELNIPHDAVVYFSGQKGYKRHPDTARLQMKIIKNVPNSYFLIKGYADKEAINTFFTKLAEEEGVARERLRFLPPAPTEAIHRANLGIADVVLDTYPYNGATTTLETLWIGIPLVTRVGEQFAARNSYTMMMNVGVSEGIAWSDEEYVEWGIRLGKDPLLRQDISWRLQRSRQTSPLWNAEQFTRNMEKAYQQMWMNYIQPDQG